MIKVSTIYRLPATKAHRGHCGVCGVVDHLPWRDSACAMFVGSCCVQDVLCAGMVLDGVEDLRAPLPLEIPPEQNR